MPELPGVLASLLAATHLIVPEDLPAAIQDHAADLGAVTVTLHLVDLEQHVLVPLHTDGTAGTPVPIDTTAAGAAFRQMEIVDTVGDGRRVLWVPVLDGTERVGVLEVALADAGSDADTELVKAFSGLVAELVLTKTAYGDFFEVARRQDEVTVAAELLWQLLPPLTFGADDVVIAAAFVPTADLGGDAFDYGVGIHEAKVAIFDALGHGLTAGLMSTTAVAAYRNSRRRGLDLRSAAGHVGSAIAGEFGDSRFVTGILLSLDRASGLLSWCVAGHPPPLLVRDHHVVKVLDGGAGTPFGVGAASDVVREQLEPGDRVVLYTDGVTEARTADGSFFGVEGLVDLLTDTGDDPPPETLRRLMHAVEEHNEGPMRDDATVVMVEWRRGASTGQMTVGSEPVTA